VPESGRDCKLEVVGTQSENIERCAVLEGLKSLDECGFVCAASGIIGEGFTE